MKRFLRYLRSSFSARLSLWVTVIVTVIYVVSLYLIFQFSLSVKDESLVSIVQTLIEADYKRLVWVANLTVIVGLFLMLLACRLLIDRALKPLDTLAHNVRNLSDNYFGETKSVSGRKDEIGGLQTSVATMQKTLAGYIGEIQQKTEDLKQRQHELEEANKRAQEDQRVKTVFLSSMTRQIGIPVSGIHQLTTTLADNYQELSLEEMSRIRSEILSHTNEITLLVDQQLMFSQQSGTTS